MMSTGNVIDFANFTKRLAMKILIKVTLLSTVIFLSWQALPQERAAEPQNTDKEQEQLIETKRLFTENCVRCHGDDGQGNTTTGAMLDVPDFTNQKFWQEDVKDERLAGSIRNGKSGMPRFEKKLTDQQIASLIKYVRQFDKSRQENSSGKP
jgi:mono/diheme cytochrome c family protein